MYKFQYKIFILNFLTCTMLHMFFFFFDKMLQMFEKPFYKIVLVKSKLGLKLLFLWRHLNYWKNYYFRRGNSKWTRSQELPFLCYGLVGIFVQTILSNNCIYFFDPIIWFFFHFLSLNFYFRKSIHVNEWLIIHCEYLIWK